MLGNNGELGQALGAGGADVILAHNFQQAGAHQAGQVADGIAAHGDDGQDVALPAVQAEGRQYVQLKGEYINQHGGDHERRNGNADGGNGHQQHILPFAVFQRGQYAHGDGGKQHKHQGDKAQLGGYRRTSGNKIVDGFAGIFIGRAEIAMQQAAQIFDKLHRHGLVQAVLGFHGLGNLFRHALGVGERATGNGVHQGEGDQNNHEHGNDHGSDALQDKFNHYVSFFRVHGRRTGNGAPTAALWP